jgi:hypothetical protein
VENRDAGVSEGAGGADRGRSVGKGKRKRRIAAKLRPKVRIEVRITAPSTIGRYRTFTVRARKKPLSKAGCLAAGTSRRIAC